MDKGSVFSRLSNWAVPWVLVAALAIDTLRIVCINDSSYAKAPIFFTLIGHYRKTDERIYLGESSSIADL